MKALLFYWSPVKKADKGFRGDEYTPIYSGDDLIGHIRLEWHRGDENEALAGHNPRPGETVLNAVQYET